MDNKFFVGDVIANGLDPLAHDFACGSISSIGADGYWIGLPGNVNEKIPCKRAVALSEVFTRNPEIVVVMNKKEWATRGFFVGGVVMKNDITTKKYVVKINQGHCFMPYDQSIFKTGRSFQE